MTRALIIIALAFVQIHCATVLRNIASKGTFENVDRNSAYELESEPHELNSLLVSSRSKRAILREKVKMPTGAEFYITTPMTHRRCGAKAITLTLYPRGRMSRREYEIVSNEVHRTKIDIPNCATNGGCFKSFKILRIRKVVNDCLRNRYNDRKMDIMRDSGVSDANERMLFYDIGANSVWNLVNRGLDERLSKGGSFGAGLYFTDHSSVANIHSENKECSTCLRKMLLCRVILGKEFKKDGGVANAHAPVGHDSVVGKQTGNSYNDYVVYRGEQAYPEYVITYKLVS